MKVSFRSMRSGQIRNCESARVSMPGQLKSVSTGEEGVNFIGKEVSPGEGPSSGSLTNDAIIEEADETDEHTFQPPQPKEVS